MKKLIQLYVSWFKLGLFTFGGGYARLPMIQKKVIEKYPWATEAEVNAVPVEEVDTEEVNELKYRIAELKEEVENLKAWNKDLQECIEDQVDEFYAEHSDENIDRMFNEYAEDVREFAEEAQRLAEGIVEDGFFVPAKGNENKIKRWLKDSAKMYHPDKPTGDTEMMMFINDIREMNKKF